MSENKPDSADCDAPRWHPGWRIGHRRWDWLRSTRCLLTGHRWEVNYHETQRVCHGCHTAQDRLPDQWRTPVCRHGHASRQECCTCCGWATRGGIACCGTCPTPPGGGHK